MRLFVAYFSDEESVLHATSAARTQGFSVHDVYSPYAIHGIDEAMGLAPSRLTWVCLGMALFGLASALVLQDWTSAASWPLNVGGKPFHSLPAFVPVMFELTVLCAALGTVAALFLRTKLRPRIDPALLLPRTTLDRFALAIDAHGDQFNAEVARHLSARFGADHTEFVEVLP